MAAMFEIEPRPRRAGSRDPVQSEPNSGLPPEGRESKAACRRQTTCVTTTQKGLDATA